MINLKAISRRSLKKILAQSFILLDRCKELLTVKNGLIDLADIKKIVIVEMQGFGDALAVMPTAKILKEKFEKVDKNSELELVLLRDCEMRIFEK